MKKILLGLFLSVNLFAQTKVDLLTQVKVPVAVNGASIIMNVPTKGIQFVALDPSLVLTLDVTGGYTLRAVTDTPPPIVIPTLVLVTDTFKQVSPNMGKVFTTSKIVNGGKNNLTVFKNGMFQNDGDDYVSVFNPGDGTVTITFPNVSSDGDIVKLRYF